MSDPDAPEDQAAAPGVRATTAAPGVPPAPAVPPALLVRPAAAWQPDDPAYEARVLRAFIRDGRLVSIPARERKRRVIYRFLVDEVLPDPDAEVDERDLNMRLALWNPDVSTIRRGLIDLRLATRNGMTYRRAVPLRLPAAARPRFRAPGA